MKSGVAVTVTTWGGHQIRGTVSDREPAGLLLEVDGGTEGYVFLPWSSVEQVDIPEVAHRRVKFLHG